MSWLPVLIEKLKVEPMVREKVKAWPWLASVWQRAKHWEAKEALSSPTAGHMDDRYHDDSGYSMMTGAPIKEEERATVNTFNLI